MILSRWGFSMVLLVVSAALVFSAPLRAEHASPESIATQVIWSTLRHPLVSVDLDVTSTGTGQTPVSWLPPRLTAQMSYDKVAQDRADFRLELRGKGVFSELSAVILKIDEDGFCELKRGDGSVLRYRFDASARSQRKVPGLLKRRRQRVARQARPPQAVEREMNKSLQQVGLSFEAPDFLRTAAQGAGRRFSLRFDPETMLVRQCTVADEHLGFLIQLEFDNWRFGEPLDRSLPTAEESFLPFGVRDIGSVLLFLLHTKAVPSKQE